MRPLPPTSPADTFETHQGHDLRLRLFYPVIAGLLLVLAGGLAWQQLLHNEEHDEHERVQNHRRILIPGPRGNIYDRDGRLLAGNRARFAVVLHLYQLQRELRAEYLRVRTNYRDLGDANLPSASALVDIARRSVVQRYLDEVNTVLGTSYQVDTKTLYRHFSQEMLLPYTLLDDLGDDDCARLLEHLPVHSPLEITTSSLRYYPYGRLAAHALGHVAKDDVAIEDFPGEDLKTFAFPGSTGKGGIESEYDSRMQGQPGGVIFRVDPSGYRIDPPLSHRVPIQGGSVISSIDIDLQDAAETAMGFGDEGLSGAAVAMDISTGEVLVLASHPTYDLNAFSPHLSFDDAKAMQERGAWLNRAVNGLYLPGSTFKLIISLAGLRAGTITPDSSSICLGTLRVGNHTFVCNNHRDRGKITFAQAIEKSCNVFFYEHGIATGIDDVAAEAARFGLTQPTGVDMPYETDNTYVGTPEWKRRRFGQSWTTGDMANLSIGQGFVNVTPLQMCCFVSSLARGETRTEPYMLHQEGRPRQHTSSIGLKPELLTALREGMELCTREGTGKLARPRSMPELRIAGKTGTAQVQRKIGELDLAWFVGYAPAENPKIAIAVVMEGDAPDEVYHGGTYAAPIASAIFERYFQKHPWPAPQSVALAQQPAGTR